MAFTGSFLCTSFKGELFSATHVLTASAGDTFKIALYTSSATMDASTAVYSATNEVAGTNYVAGGITLTNLDPATGGVVGYVQFGNATFTNVSVTARGALIYNSSKGNKAVCVLDFGADKTASAGDFIVNMPANTSTTALLRLT